MDEARLMEYVDGTLTAAERADVEREIAASPDVAECVARLEASRLPYRDAFAHQQLPPVPAALAARVDALARQYGTRAAGAARRDGDRWLGKVSDVAAAPGSNDATMPGNVAGAPVRSRLRVAPAWLAVAFVAGAFSVGLVLRFGPAGMAGAAAPMPWVEAATGYQQLYTRATVADTQPDAAAVSRTIDAVRNDDRLALRVPDLRDAGMRFSEIQRLRFNGKPLVQLVYLPAHGEPVALCVTKQVGPDQPIVRRTVNGMNVATWRQGELAYALISASPGVDLAGLGRRIADRSFDQISGSGAMPGRGDAQQDGWG